MRLASIKELDDWEQQGAVWRLAEVTSQHAVIELCSCSGELMERVESEDPELIAFAQARRSD